VILEDALSATGSMSGNKSDLPPVRATLDDLFRRAVAERPNALALVDPPDRLSFTDGPVRRLTYAQADRAISALAARLRGFGLPTDSVVAIQLPNTVESVIALLAVLRAGLIAVAVALFLGAAVNDSGVAVPATAAALLVPLLVWLAAAPHETSGTVPGEAGDRVTVVSRGSTVWNA
jgi:acyl-CoA synthetase (AMP-forming)/AMP-acid ligase II